MFPSGFVTVLIAIVVLMAAGGLIAYLGDRWGYELGKKRLSVFGMRPKKTASFLTVVAGTVIALVTFAVLFSLNAGFRVALLRGAALLHDIHQYRREIKTSTAEIQSLQGQEAGLQQEADRYRLEEQQEAAREKQARASLSQAKTQLATRQTELQAVNAKLVAANTQVAAAEAKVAALQVRQIALTRLNDDLDQNIHVRIKNPLLYANNAEVGRQVVSSAQSEAAIRRDLVAFLGKLSSEAEQLGAAPTRNNRAVVVASVKIGSSPTFAQESDSLDALADQIHAHGAGSVVVIAYAAGNAFANKPVYVRLVPFQNRLVIPAGTVLGETVIPRQQKGVAEILSDMESFLHGPVHQAALRRGVIPVMPENDIGGIGAGEIDPTVAQIQGIKGDAVVVALAARDIYTADQVSLDFTVRSSSALPIAQQATRP